MLSLLVFGFISMKQLGQRGALDVIKLIEVYAVFSRYNCCPKKHPISPKHVPINDKHQAV
jgi:hypothetical protein